MLPAAARFYSVAAMKAGLRVQVESRKVESYCNSDFGLERNMITWRGSKEQFVQTGLFVTQFFERLVNGSRHHVKTIGGHVQRLGANEFLYAIERAVAPSKILAGRHVQNARAEESFLNFRDRSMAGYPLANLEDLP